MRRKESHLLRVISSVLVCFVIAYMGYHAVAAFDDPLQTVVAVQFAVEDAIPVEGWFVRDERLIGAGTEGGYIAEQCVDDGTRVAKGDAVYKLYGDQSALAVSARLSELERRIADMEHARGMSTGAMDAAHMDVLIFRHLADMLDARDRRRRSAENSMLEFKSMVFRREYAFGSGTDLSAALSGLYEQAEALSGSGDRTAETRTVTAPQSGTFSAQTDGYEEFLTPGLLDDLTVEDFLSLGDTRGAAGEGTGKLAIGFQWYHVILLPEEEARNLTGKKMTLRFAAEGTGDVVFTVERVSPPQDGQAAVVLSTTRNIGEFINVRRMPADLVLRMFSGLRVPRNAIRQNPATGQFGVFCLVGSQIVFKPVDILTERENYYLAAFDPLTATLKDLIPGDEMVVKGKDLYDGKVYLQS